VDNGDCSGDTPTCNLTSQTCAASCATNDDCTDSVCDTVALICVECVASTDCTDSVCDTTVQMCVECLTSDDCTDSVCDTTAQMCVECLTSDDCTDSVCDTGALVCVECLVTTDCDTTAGEVCSAEHVCAAPAVPDTASSAVMTALLADPVDASGSLNRVAVTYIKANVGNDTAGFFVQAEQTGPALFVAVDPTALDDGNGGTFPLNAGDIISFDIIADPACTVAPCPLLVDVTKRPEAHFIGLVTVNGTGYDVSQLTQDLSSEATIQSSVYDFVYELVTVTFTLATDFSFGGVGHVVADVDTAGDTGNENLEFRIPDTLFPQLLMVTGCQLTVTNTPLWSYEGANPPARAQISAYNASEVTINSCPPATVTGAQATGPTVVTLTFSSALDDTSVLADGSQFTIDGLTVTAAAATANTVVLTTDAQTGGANYTIVVATTVMDIFGTALASDGNTVDFVGYTVAPSPGDIIVSEYLTSPTNMEFIELRNTTATEFNLAGCSIGDLGSDDHTIAASLPIPAGGYVTLAKDLANAGFTGDYEYGTGVALSPNDEAVLRCFGTVIDCISWGTGDPCEAGDTPSTMPSETGSNTVSLDSALTTPPALDVQNNDGTNWCHGASTYNGGANVGTPGAANDVCQ
jgi:hypothetical protein